MSGTHAPVLVLDEKDRGDIGLVRSLGLAGISVHLATDRPRGATAASRFVAHLHMLPPEDRGREERVEAVRSIALSMGGRPPVMMAGDGMLELVTEHRDDLEDVIRHDLPSREVVRTCFHKDRFAVEGMRLGLPVPETHVAESLSHVADLAPRLKYPVFVKPFTKKAWARLPAGVVEEEKGQKVERAEPLVELFRRLEPHGEDSAIIQHYVHSPDSEHYSVHAYVAPDGTFVGAFTTRKIRVWPPHRGIGSLVTSERVPELVDLTADVLGRLAYTGFALVQFKRDLGSGKFLLLEINCRFSTSGELAARCGANFPAASYAVMTDRPLPEVTQEEGPAWLDLERDISAMRLYRRLGEWSWLGFLKSLSSVRYPAYLAMDDPRPFARRVRHRVLRSLGRQSDSG